MASRHTDICNVDRPNLIWDKHNFISEPVRNDGFLEISLGKILFWADRVDSHDVHEATNHLPGNMNTVLILQLDDKLSGSQVWHLGMPVINPGHYVLFPQMFFFIRWGGLIIKCRSGNSQKLTLTPDGQFTVLSDQFVGLDFQFGESNPGESHVPE